MKVKVKRSSCIQRLPPRLASHLAWLTAPPGRPPRPRSCRRAAPPPKHARALVVPTHLHFRRIRCGAVQVDPRLTPGFHS